MDRLQAQAKEGKKVGLVRKIDLGAVWDHNVLDKDLQNIADELNERSKDLLQAHIKKTKHFYRKIKKYTAYVSTPSVTAEDCRKKQEMIEKLSRTHEQPGG